MIHINTALAVFNLLPVYPLDGGQIFGNLISKYNPGLSQNLLTYGPKVLLGIILFGLFTGKSILWLIIGPIINIILRFFDLIIIFIFKIF